MDQHTIVWDWDWSAVNENTDVFVPKALCEDARAHIAEHAGRKQWTSLMHEAAGIMHAAGVVRADIDRALQSLPVFPEVISALLTAQSHGLTQVVVSDANTEYIDTMSRHMGVKSAISRVITNPARYDDAGRLHIEAHQRSTEPHACELCPVNLCKGGALDTLGLSHAVRVGAGRVLYVGDGMGDLCACLRLRKGDVVAARDGSGFRLLGALTSGSHAPSVRAAVKPWKDGAELLAIVMDFLGSSPARQ